METTSSTATQPSLQTDTMKKAIQTQEEMAARVIESSQQQSQAVAQEQAQVDTAQKTGLGNSLDLQG
ncbi:MAG: hypothetical protein AB7D43_07945 [Sulfurimonadaceae bacterium]|jgi:carbohydrate-binding DOMON domain-containing protein